MTVSENTLLIRLTTPTVKSSFVRILGSNLSRKDITITMKESELKLTRMMFLNSEKN